MLKSVRRHGGWITETRYCRKPCNAVLAIEWQAQKPNPAGDVTSGIKTPLGTTPWADIELDGNQHVMLVFFPSTTTEGLHVISSAKSKEGRFGMSIGTGRHLREAVSWNASVDDPAPKMDERALREIGVMGFLYLEPLLKIVKQEFAKAAGAAPASVEKKPRAKRKKAAAEL